MERLRNIRISTISYMQMQKKLLTLILPGLMAAPAALAQLPVQRVAKSLPVENSLREKITPPQKLRILEQSNGSLTADFSCRDAANETVFWSENFDNGMDGWTETKGETQEVTWTLKQNSALPFSAIDPEDKQSLFVDGPYQIFKREISSLTSPQISIPDNAMLRLWMCFSLNFNDECALEISISTDGFETSERLYTTLDETGEKQNQWRAISASLEQYAGQTAQIRFTYTYGKKENFQTGGYMGSFYIDGITVSGSQPVTEINVMTGEEIEFVDLSAGDPVEWLWTMPGAVPETSTEKNPTVYYTRDGKYDVTLRVKDAAGNEAEVTKPGLVNVTGTEPVARITPPATFRYASTRRHMVAPMAKVTFTDGSDGFPTAWDWDITGVCEDNNDHLTANTESVDVNYWWQHDWDATLTVSNQHGTSTATAPMSAEYYGSVSNLLPGDNLTTFSLEGRGTFPGSNSMGITAYAEKFSKPSVPIVLAGATVFFTKNTTVELIDQIADVGVHLYTCENGKPGKKIDSDWWRVFELEISEDPSTVAGTSFEFSSHPVINDEFFIVVDGIPDITYEADVAFAMASFRGSDGTAWMLKNGEWIEVSSYFPAGANHTSYAIYPYITHSVMSPLPLTTSSTIEVSGNKGTAEYQFFSLMGYETPVCDSDWCRVISEPNGLTLDTLVIEYDENPSETADRTAHITLTDGASEYVITVHQDSRQGGIAEAAADSSISMQGGILTVNAAEGTQVAVYTAEGTQVAAATGSAVIDLRGMAAGLYIVRAGDTVRKVIL